MECEVGEVGRSCELEILSGPGVRVCLFEALATCCGLGVLRQQLLVIGGSVLKGALTT
jgi:hypothetical protein